MVTSFQFAPCPKLYVGAGSFDGLPAHIQSLGAKALLVTGRSSLEASPFWSYLQQGLDQRGIPYAHWRIEGEPSPGQVDDCVQSHRQAGIEVVVAIGGGSVLDGGKAISAMLMEQGGVKQYLEGVGSRQPSGRKVPFIAVPTTAGTGSEATKNAVLSEPGPQGYKKSLRHERFVPDMAVVDPRLTLSCPPHITAASGMDAFTQLLEAYLSTAASPLTDALALEGLAAIRKGLPEAFEQGHSTEARSQMAYAALLSGLCLANAGLGLVHGFASSVGGRHHIPHGALCARLMGPVNRITLRAIFRSQQDQQALHKYAQAGRLFTQKEKQSPAYYATFLIELIEAWTAAFHLPSLSDYHINSQHFPEIIDHTSHKNHPVSLSRAELLEILQACL
ncbi:MAG: iron-containing alcohol dehydrogenase [Bacteroidetes bacterium]|nr:MAG: iron-containing alcohol dehydrogenase [Bacteroidota bacterium]